MVADFVDLHALCHAIEPLRQEIADPSPLTHKVAHIMSGTYALTLRTTIILVDPISSAENWLVEIAD